MINIWTIHRRVALRGQARLVQIQTYRVGSYAFSLRVTTYHLDFSPDWNFIMFCRICTRACPSPSPRLDSCHFPLPLLSPLPTIRALLLSLGTSSVAALDV